MTYAPDSQSSICFGAFEFSPRLRRLERDGAVVELSSRAIDMLAVLTERPGEVVSKFELLERAWPDTAVVESALRVHMVALRRALGDVKGGGNVIATVPGRGYCFVGQPRPALAAANGGSVPPVAMRPLPARPTRVVGRDEVVAALREQLGRQRLVTVVGPGGIGKTTVALSAAHDWVAAGGRRTVFIDLGDLPSDRPESLAEALCAKLEITPTDDGPIEHSIAHLRAHPALIVLDTCEGAIEAAAQLAEALGSSAPGVRVLATSREALRAEGELVVRLAPLASPPAGMELTAREVLAYPAAQLFVQRVIASHLGFELSDEQANLVGRICRELDGLALAIELAAGRVAAFGIQRVAQLLSTEFALTWPGRRTALPRQQTLRATLNWSYELLDPAERIVLRRLSTLVGAFTLESATAVCVDGPDMPPSVVADTLFGLVAKSLLNPVDDSEGRFRMLDMTRSFARAKLAESGEEQAARRIHAEHFLGRLTAGEPTHDEPAALAEVTANVSAALAWAFGAPGDTSIGVRLASAAAGLWVRNGMLGECRRWADVVRAYTDNDSSPENLRATLMLSSALMVTDGVGAERRLAAVSAYVDKLGESQRDEKLAGLFLLWAGEHRRCRYAAAQRLIDEADFLRKPDASHFHRLTALWMLGMTDHCAGRQAAAREHLSELLEEYTEDVGYRFLELHGYDLEAAGATILGMTEFLRGNLDKAFAASDRAAAKARTLSSTVSLGAVMRWRATMMYFRDEDGLDVDHVRREILPETAFAYADNRPEGTALAVHGLWLARSGDYLRGAELVRRGLEASLKADYLTIVSFVRAEIALQLVRYGVQDSADEFLAPLEAEVGEEEGGWAAPEILRIRGEIAERRGDLVAAEILYRAAVDLAERQGALTWRLRAAISLAELWLKHGRATDAPDLLMQVRKEFGAGVDWALLRRADDRLTACSAVRTVDRLDRHRG